MNLYFKEFYQKLIDNRKQKKLAHVAVGYKFLRVCLAVMKSRRVFNPPSWKDQKKVQQCVRWEGVQVLRDLGLVEKIDTDVKPKNDALDIDAIENAFTEDANLILIKDAHPVDPSSALATAGRRSWPRYRATVS